jgi:hypothetical protein
MFFPLADSLLFVQLRQRLSCSLENEHAALVAAPIIQLSDIQKCV